jgi:hypothetical protein
MPAKKRKMASDGAAAQAQALLERYAAASSGLLSALDGAEAGAASAPSSSVASLGPLLAEMSSTFLVLKSSQRDICLLVESDGGLAGGAASARENIGARTLELQNLLYERDHLRDKVRECRDYGFGHLVSMAREEIGGKVPAPDDDQQEEEEEEGEEEEEDAEELVNRFLSRGGDASVPASAGDGYDHRDPSNHQGNLATLKAELTIRRNAEAELAKAKKELMDLRKKTGSRKAFLASLPKKLREVERSSATLQAYFRGAVGVAGAALEGGATAEAAVTAATMGGPERAARVEAARGLPPPLYALFLQLSGYLDAFVPDGSIRLDVTQDPSTKGIAPRGEEEEGEEDQRSQNSRGTEEWTARDGGVVTLTLPVPGVEGLPGKAALSSSATVAVKFRYLPRLGVITASASPSGGNRADSVAFLSALFPDDDGTTLPSCASAFLIGGDGGPAATATALSEVEAALVRRGDRPYRWCQFVSGLIMPPAQPEGAREGGPALSVRGTMEPSTRAVVRALVRRVRARSTLHGLLSVLEKGTPLNPIPVHPSLAGGSQPPATSSSRLSSWSETTGTTPGCRYYSVAVKHSKGPTLRGTVKIDPSYPAVPPLWSLQPATADLDDRGGGAASWGERRGTAASLQDPSGDARDPSSSPPPLFDPIMGSLEDAVNADLSGLVVDGVEESYDWILSSQIRMLLQRFDALQEGTGGGTDKAPVGGRFCLAYDLYSRGL